MADLEQRNTQVMTGLESNGVTRGWKWRRIYLSRSCTIVKVSLYLSDLGCVGFIWSITVAK